MSEWFNDVPQFERRPVQVVHVVWRCPKAGCSGTMNYIGEYWATGTPGYHHTCTACGYTAALRGERFPKIEYEPRC